MGILPNRLTGETQVTSLNNPLEEKTITDIVISFVDRSRMISGDRWSVEIVCEATMQTPENFWASVSEDDKNLLDSIRRKMGSSLKFSVSRFRNFLPKDDKQAVIAKLASDFEEHMVKYAGNPVFKLNLFEKEYNAAKQEYLAEKNQEQATEPLDDEDTGPADFSYLFK